VFTEFGPVPARARAVVYLTTKHHVTRADSGIRTVADLRGKVVSLGTPGGGGTVQAERVLAAAGLDARRDFRAQNLGVAQAVDALKDSKLDALFWSGGVPTAAIEDLVHTPGITARLLPLDEWLPALQQQYGKDLYFRIVIPKGMYRLAEDVPVVGVANMLVVSESMPEPLAHDITKTIFEQQPTLAGIHPQGRELAIDKALKGATIPFHPGAIRYYRERGVWKE
jgi:TRAP transporter TAXI family solute receptor